jgi:tRNA modification GTPase
VWTSCGLDTLEISAHTGEGIDALRAAIISVLSGDETGRDTPAITNARHVDLLTRAAEVLRRAAAAARDGVPEECVAADVADARVLLEEVTGMRTTDDVLHAIFDKFCIGK